MVRHRYPPIAVQISTVPRVVKIASVQLQRFCLCHWSCALNAFDLKKPLLLVLNAVIKISVAIVDLLRNKDREVPVLRDRIR